MPVEGPILGPISKRDISKSEFKNEISSSALLDIQLTLQSWMTIKKTEISAQHEFLKPIYLCVHSGIVLIYLDVHQKC